MSPGDVVLIDFDPTMGNDEGGRRPAVVISTVDYDRLVAGRLLVVCPVTSRDRGLAHHVPVTPASTHLLNRPSWVMCEQPRTISSRRVSRALGALIPADTANIATIVRRLLHQP